MKRLATIAAIAAIGLLGLSSPAETAKPKPVRHDQLPLHLGSYGPRVVELQELLAGKDGNVFHGVKPIYKGKPNGLFGATTKADLYAYKFRLGYPDRFNHKANPIAGADFFALLHGKQKRTLEMVGWAQLRLQAVEAGATVTALEIKKVEISQLGADENLGPNCGTQIDKYFAYFHIGCGLAWCAIFQQYSFAQAGYKPPFADRSFGVLQIEAWAHARGYLRAKAKVGDLVAFLDDGGHIGFVARVLASGYVSLEGNSSDAVREIYHPWNFRLRVFIALPSVA